MTADDYQDLTLRQFLGVLSAAEPAPSGGGTAALAVALGASLCAMAAGLSGRRLGPEAGRLRDEAGRLRDRAAALIQADADGYRAVLTARRQAAADPAADGAALLSQALADAAAVPMDIVELGVAVTGLAARLAADGNPQLRGDALTGGLLAEAGARSAAALVHINLAGDSGDGRPARADALLAGAAQATGALRAAVSGSRP